MKKFFEKAEMEIVEFEAEDVITTSNIDDSGVEKPGLNEDIDVL